MYALVVPQEVSDVRMRICERCPYLSQPLARCSVCNCLMGLKTKLADASCPLQLWKKHKGE